MSLGDFLWSLLVIYFIFFYFMMVFRILGDLFSDPDTSGVAKALWVVFLLFLPFIAILVYLITRGRRMTERAIADSLAANAEQQEYIRRVAGSNGQPAAQIAKGHELLESGAITQEEFDTLKAKALA
jgi:ABC-type multidrug transport system fused ATPase/permease subunit